MIVSRSRIVAALALPLALAAASAAAAAQQLGPALYAGMHWRLIGPFRGGRTVGASGVPGQPNVFYVGVNDGGVWKTTDYGHTWTPIFDGQPTASIGTLAVAPSNPNVIYVGTPKSLPKLPVELPKGMGITRVPGEQAVVISGETSKDATTAAMDYTLRYWRTAKDAACRRVPLVDRKIAAGGDAGQLP